jgi:hypothetical protein
LLEFEKCNRDKARHGSEPHVDVSTVRVPLASRKGEFLEMPGDRLAPHGSKSIVLTTAPLLFVTRERILMHQDLYDLKGSANSLEYVF